jgi:hypothetical protein
VPGRDIRGDPHRVGRGLPCGCSSGRFCIVLHWRDQAGLAETRPGKWTGPCPKDGNPGALHAQEGDNGGVIWAVPGCKSTHDREAAYPALKAKVPCAPEPGHRRNPELDALTKRIRALAMNEGFIRSAPIRLALLEVLGDDTDDALDTLGITDATWRRRIRQARSKALSPAKSGVNDSYRRSGAPKQEDGATATLPPPAETHLPAKSGVNDHSEVALTPLFAGRESGQKPPLTSTNGGLTTHAKVVSGPAGTDTSTDTGLDLDLALELLRTKVGAEVIATEPRTSPDPVADITEVWTASEAGPCRRCGTTTCLYGDRGSLFCADCRTPAGRWAG